MMSVVTAMRALLARQRQIVEDKVSSPTYQGTVTGVDGTTATVLLDGGDSLGTPCQMRVACAEGDRVSVTVEGHAAYVTGNMTRPATDDTVATIAQAIAAEAQAIANAVNQHFFADGQGVHVTEAAGDATTEHNVLINSLGFLLRKATAPLMALSASAVAFYDGLGDTAASIVARFGKDGSQIGRDGESHVELDYHSMKMVDSDGDTYFYVSDLRDASGYATVTQGRFYGSETSYISEISLDLPAVTTEEFSVMGNWDETDLTPHATLYKNKVVLDNSYGVQNSNVLVTYKTESQYAKAYTLGMRAADTPTGALSVAEGKDTAAIGVASHAEGDMAYAWGKASHAEGAGMADGRYSHAENSGDAHGDYSHAEGTGHANGKYSHAQNEATIAASDAQTVIGRCNVEDANDKYVFIIGNGTASRRSNAYAVQWDGTVESALDVPWTLLTLDSACHAYNDATANAPRYRRWGQLVTVTGIIAPTAEVAAGGSMAIATLPAGVRPHQEIDLKCQGSNRSHWCLRITAAGAMTAQRYGDENGAQAMGTGIWMPFTATYLV